jgi:hypothetical protein
MFLVFMFFVVGRYLLCKLPEILVPQNFMNF